MANEDLEGLGPTELHGEIARCHGVQQALADHLADLTKLVEQRGRDKKTRRIDLGIGVIGAVGGILTTALTPAGLVLAALGGFSLYRSGLAHFTAAAGDNELRAQLDAIRQRMVENEARAEAAYRIVQSRQP